MPWTSKFKTPLLLKGGQTIETLADARAVILALPEYQQRRDYWGYAATLLMKAAQSGKRDAIEDAYWQAYRTSVSPTVQKFGGRFLVRGGEPKAIEGGGFGSRVIVIEFDSSEQVMAWYNSPEYQAIVPIRHANATTRAACLIGP